MENSHYSNNNPNNNIGSRRGRGGQAGQHGGRGATIGFMSFRTPRRFANDEEHSSSVGGAAAASPSSSSSAAALSMMPTKRQRIRLDSNNAANQRRDGAGFWEDRGGEREQQQQRRTNANNNFGRQNRPYGVNPKPLHQQHRRQHQYRGHHQQNHQQNNQQQQQHQFRQPQNFIAQANQFRGPSAAVDTSSGPTNPQQQQIRSAELSDIPGFSYDPVTKKYFKILEDKPGQPSGSTLRHLRNLAVNAASSNFGDTSGEGGRRSTPPAINLPALLNRLQVSGGGRSQLLANARSIEEARLRCVKAMPSYRFEVVDNWSQRFDSCQFLDVSEDGRTLLGCWSTERHDIFSAQCSRVLSFTVGVNPESGRRDAELADLDPQHPKLHDTNGRFACNTYGLQFTALDNGICLETSHQQLVDMALAPADRDVTCLLFATAGSIFEQKSVNACPRIITKCIVNLRPIEFNLTEEGRESMSSPIYNAEWTSNEPIWSLCFNSHHMKICVGMEKNARILNVLSGQDFLVSSGGRNVISCLFSKDGNSLHLGRKCANISLLDLRMPSNHSIGELPGTPSSSFMYLFRERGNTLLSENFEGKIKLWDLRMRRELLQMEAGHRNSSHKLPMFVDSEERLVFAVGEDSAVRGWSLHSGELLCSVNSPRAHIQQKAQAQMRSGGGRRSGGGGMQTADESTTASSTCAIDFPRVVYSSSWGGRVGNSALLFAVNGDLLVHELSL